MRAAALPGGPQAAAPPAALPLPPAESAAPGLAKESCWQTLLCSV